MKTFFVVNPNSANGSTGRRWAAMQAKIAKALPEAAHAFTERPLHATELARKALKDGFHCIVAAGGDGTLNEVVNGFFEDGKSISPGASLGVLPTGTGGDFRRTFGSDLDIDKALARIASGKDIPLDLGRLEFMGHDGRTGTRYFVNICSFGVSGQVVHEANHTSKALGGRISFTIASLKALAKYTNRKVRFSLDGKPSEEAPVVTTLAVANGKFFGGGMHVAPDASPSDGTFDLTLWSGFTFWDFVLKQGGLYSGAHVTWPGTRRMQCKTITAECDQEVLIDCDGEQPGKLPCAMTVLPSALRLRT